MYTKYIINTIKIEQNKELSKEKQKIRVEKDTEKLEIELIQSFKLSILQLQCEQYWNKTEFAEKEEEKTELTYPIGFFLF